MSRQTWLPWLVLGGVLTFFGSNCGPLVPSSSKEKFSHWDREDSGPPKVFTVITAAGVVYRSADLSPTDSRSWRVVPHADERGLYELARVARECSSAGTCKQIYRLEPKKL
jgi:hypothetical protein